LKDEQGGRENIEGERGGEFEKKKKEMDRQISGRSLGWTAQRRGSFYTEGGEGGEKRFERGGKKAGTCFGVWGGEKKKKSRSKRMEKRKKLQEKRSKKSTDKKGLKILS